MKKQTEAIIPELEAQRDRLVRAIDILRADPKHKGRRSRLSAAGRKRISKAMKRRWAKRRKAR
jgi:hypothetical protein